jgi:hypothetical protein
MRGGNHWFGNDDIFSAGFDYKIGFKVARAKKHPTHGHACEFNGSAVANMNAGASILGSRKWAQGLPSGISGATDLLKKIGEAVVAKNEFNVDTNKASYASSLKILGEDVYTPRAGEYPSNYTWELIDKEDFINVGEVSTTFVIVVVPVTLRAWGELRYGMQSYAKSQVTNTCTSTTQEAPKFGFALTVTPWARLDAYGSAAVGIPGFEVGVRGNINLVHANLPILGEINVAEKSTDRNIAVLKFDTSGRLDLSELAGRIQLYAKAPLFKPYQKELFSWDGFHQTLPLWNVREEVTLGAFNLD